MKQIDDQTVEFTQPVELVARVYFDHELADGNGIASAAKIALNRARMRTQTMPSDKFIEYLSENTCQRWGNRIRIRPLHGFHSRKKADQRRLAAMQKATLALHTADVHDNCAPGCGAGCDS